MQIEARKFAMWVLKAAGWVVVFCVALAILFVIVYWREIIEWYTCVW